VAYLFLDNRGRANVYDKKELVPGGMKVLLGTKYNNQIVNLDVFFTAVKVNRKASRQIRRALDRTFHIFQFGEDKADIVLQGLAIAESQANNRWKENMNTELRQFDVGHDEARFLVEQKLRELGEYTWEDESQRIWYGEDEDGNPVPFYEGVVAKSEQPNQNKLTEFFQGIRDWAYTPGGSEDKFLPKVYKGLNTSIEAINQYVISPIANLGGETLKTLKHLLGISEAENQLDTRQVDMKIGTITELNAFFHAFNSGNHNSKIVCSICGIPVKGLLDQLTFQSLPKGQGYSFTLSLTGLKFYDGVVKNSYIDPVVLHPEAGSDLAGILQGAGQIGINAIRTGDSDLTRIF
jgi:hypothetical protein